MTDALDLMIAASEESSKAARVDGFRLALRTLDSPNSDLAPAVSSSVFARATCGLARDGEASYEDAARAVSQAIEAGEPCAAIVTLAQTAFALGRYADAIETAKTLPRSCFRSDDLSFWRFGLWDVRAGSAFALDRRAEGFNWARRIVGSMDRDDERELAWSPPYRTVSALLEIAATDGSGAADSRAVLAEMVARVELTDWFDPIFNDRIRSAVTRR